MAIDSPLPQLDKLFDYRVPDSLYVPVGARVKVPFGRAGKTVEGLVVAIAENIEYSGQVLELAELVSTVPVMNARIYKLCRAVADRQAATLHDVLKLAVPKRSVKVEQSWEALQVAEQGRPFRFRELIFGSAPIESSQRGTAIVEPRWIRVRAAGNAVSEDMFFDVPAWIAVIARTVLQHLKSGKSSVVVVPDFRDRQQLTEALSELDLADVLVQYGSEQTPSARYLAHLRCLSQPVSVVVGSRAAGYAPVKNLGSLILWDDVDENHNELSAPYIHSRELLLLRQQIEGCQLLYFGHSRSAEVARLLSIGYLRDVSGQFAPPKVAVTASGVRFDSAAFSAVRDALRQERSVLVQVASPGAASSLFCESCGEIAKCEACHGVIGLDSRNSRFCRWCSTPQSHLSCFACGATEFRSGRAGSSRTAAELGKAFPGVLVVEATGEKVVTKLSPGKRIVVATSGAAPVVTGGYGAVVVLDGLAMLSRDSLRATERALSTWTNAIAMLGSGGRAVVVGIGEQLGKALALWNLGDWAVTEFQNRKSLGLPPALRLGSITGPTRLVQAYLSEVIANLGVTAKSLGVRQLAPGEQRAVFSFDYAAGSEMGKHTRAFVLKHAATGVKTSAAGRTSRSFRIRLDDSEVV